MIGVAVYAGAVVVAGWLLLSVADRAHRLPRLDRAVFCAPVGLTLVTITGFALNWPFHIRYTGWSVLGTALGWDVALLAALRPRVRLAEWRRRIGVEWWHPWAESRLWLEWAWRVEWRRRRRMIGIVLAAGAGLGIMLGLSLVRPIAGWDFYLYHWHYTRVVYETGQLPTQVSPSYQEEQYAYPPLPMLAYAQIALVSGSLSQLGPRVLPLLFELGIALTAARLARVVFKLSVPASACAAALSLLSGHYLTEAGQENIDTAAAFFAIAAAYWVLRRDAPMGTRIVGGAFMLAGGYWARYSGLAIFGVLGIAVAAGLLWDRVHGRPFARELLTAAGIFALGFAFCIPHLLRNAILWGNPLYPSVTGFLHGYLIDPWTIQQMAWTITPIPFGGLSAGWWSHPFQDFPSTGLALALLVGALPVVLARLRAGDPDPGRLALAAVSYFGLSLLLLRPLHSDPERYLLPLVAFIAPLGALLFDDAVRRTRPATIGVTAFLGLTTWYMAGDALVGFRLLAVGMLAAGGYLLLRPRLGRGQLGPRAGQALFPMTALPLLLVFLVFCRPDSYPGFLAQGGLLRFPEASFMAGFRPGDRYLTFEDRREALGGEPFPADSARLESFYVKRLDGQQGVKALRALGIRYVYWTSRFYSHPLMAASPLYRQLDDRRFFTPVYRLNQDGAQVTIYELNEP